MHHTGPSYIALGIGLLCVFFGVVATLRGQTVAQYGRVARRDANARQFWQSTGFQYLLGLGFIAYFLYTLL